MLLCIYAIAIHMERKCNKCGQVKPITEFYKTGRKTDKTPNQRHYICKECTKARLKTAEHQSPERKRELALRRMYGITTDEYNQMLELQSGRCAVCKTDKAGGKHNVFCVDHDHVTGKVRELLCKDCNIVLGIINDSPEHLGRLMAYILKHKDD